MMASLANEARWYKKKEVKKWGSWWVWRNNDMKADELTSEGENWGCYRDPSEGLQG